MSAPGNPMSDPTLQGDGSASADWLDRVLAGEAHSHAGEYLADDGFTARVMQTLPAPIAPPVWRKPVLAALWGAAAVGLAVALPGAAVDVARETFRLFAAKPVTLYEIAAVLAVAGLGSWTTAIYAWKRA